MMIPQSQVPGTGSHRRAQYRRSRNGCLTCKRRKVRCNEEKPRCYHCDRLSLECIWTASEVQHFPLAEARTEGHHQADQATLSTDIFDFAQSIVDGTAGFSAFQEMYFPPLSDLPVPPDAFRDQGMSPNSGTMGSTHAPSGSPCSNVSVDDSLKPNLPPILDPIENGPKCASAKELFHSLAISSSMVRYAIAAFTTIQTSSAERMADYKQYYDKAACELLEAIQKPRGTNFHWPKASMCSGHSILPHIHRSVDGSAKFGIFQLGEGSQCTPKGRYQQIGSYRFGQHALPRNLLEFMLKLSFLEQRIISWIRLLDARAASAGGEGLLVDDTSEIVYQLTPRSHGSSSQTTDPPTSSGPHEIIYEMLCQPGISFYQEVQTITVRITRIAHAHRSRGSVEDETEVMAIAADILRDLKSLHDRRPALMEYAVSGSIGEDTLAKPLASAIARSFQTYLVNFYACYIHLHRVAHRHLARSKSVSTAIQSIREILHLMASTNEHIPVNVLWPLFLWGTEEDDQDECQWILATIRSLHYIASNANMAANVLQEIQMRQREAGSRVDIRSVCLELFNTTFAIV